MSSMGQTPTDISPYSAVMAAFNPALIRPSGLGLLAPSPSAPVGSFPGAAQVNTSNEAQRHVIDNERQLMNRQRPSTISSTSLQQLPKGSQNSGNARAPPDIVPSWEGQVSTEYESVPISRDQIRKRDHSIIYSFLDCAKPNLIHCHVQLATGSWEYPGLKQNVRTMPTTIFYSLVRIEFQFSLL